MNLLKRFKFTSGHKRFTSTSPPLNVAPRVFPTTGFTTIPTSETVEEEHWAWYTPQSFYPVHVGDVLHSKDQGLYKLGFGTTATIWMCRDLRRNEYVCLKSMVYNYPSVQREIKAYKTLSESAMVSQAVGKRYVRLALDRFELAHGNRNYHFLIHEALGVTAEVFMGVCGGTLPIFYVKDLAYRMLHALEFVHNARVIHADLQAKNILLQIEDPTVLEEAEEGEMKEPSARKITEETVVFETRNLPGPVWGLIFGRHLFPRHGADEQTADKNQLARMVALLGPPPQQLLTNSGEHALLFFNEDGSAKGEVPNETLESLLASSLKRINKTMTTEESKAFLAFLKKTLTWTEEMRASASELLDDPWIERTKYE
ncbi:SRSF protein kinase 3 [Leucoagaricus sp. SymC.cos]|nr:SRSF protein kinase 3 [Leucoagaricus sp. SymC.cos]